MWQGSSTDPGGIWALLPYCSDVIIILPFCLKDYVATGNEMQVETPSTSAFPANILLLFNAFLQ